MAAVGVGVQVLRWQVESQGLSMTQLRALLRSKGICLSDGKVHSFQYLCSTCTTCTSTTKLLIAAQHISYIKFSSARTHSRSLSYTILRKRLVPGRTCIQDK